MHFLMQHCFFLYQMYALMKTEDQLLESLERCAAMIVPTSGMKMSSRYHGLGYLTGAERNTVHNRMLNRLICNFFPFTILNRSVKNNSGIRHTLTDHSRSQEGRDEAASSELVLPDPVASFTVT